MARRHDRSLTCTSVLSGIAIFALGVGITVLTGLPPIRSGLRQLAFGAAAASITYGIGVVVGSLLH